MQWQVLAGLRFLLAWIVVCYHLKDFVPNYGKDFLCIFGKLNGIAAVLGFLLISGYSIAHSVTKNPKGFYQRRILRIYPLYFCGVILSLLPFVFKSNINLGGQEFVMPSLVTLIGNLMFLQTFAVDTIQSNVVVWTLGVEVFCYILAPFFIKMSNKLLIFLTFLSALLYTAAPSVYRIFYPQSEFPFYNYFRCGVPFLLLLWAWLLGFLYFRTKQQKILKFLLVGLGTLVLVINQTHTGKIGIITYLVSSLMLIYSSFIELPKFSRGICNYLGDLSYPIYLFHMPVFIFGSYILSIKSSIILVVLSVCISILFYHCVDVPIRSRKTA